MTAEEPRRITGHAPLPDGGWLAYEVLRGSDDTRPLLLHRPLGGTTALWGPFREALSGRFRVISFDPRGVGHSSEARPLTTTLGMAEDALALLDHLGIESAHIFGLSLGGMVAMRIATIAPWRIDKLILASTTDRGITVSGAGARRGLSFARCFTKAGSHVEACIARRILSRRFHEERRDEVSRIDALIHETPTSRANLLKLVAAAARHNARADLHRIKSPTLVLAAKDDPLLDIESQFALAQRIPNAVFDVISPSGHDMSLEQPVATAARVAEFLLGS